MLEIGLSKRKNNPYVLKPNQNVPAFFEEQYASESVQICKNRMIFAVFVFCLIYLIIALRVFAVCLPHGVNINFPPEFENKKLVFKAPILRADIVDRNGFVLATSLPTVDLYANPRKIKDPQDAAEKLSMVLDNVSYDSLYAKLSKKRGSYVLLYHDLSPAKQAEVNALGIPTLEFQKSEKRVYLHDNLFAHILGYTNIDNIGQAGIEKSMHDRLTQSSKSLELTVDLGVQDTIREELLSAMETYSAVGASAILMDVNTGEILSLVSLPDFNPNIKIPVGEKALFNFPTLGIYEPGSVFKTFNTALCLESGKVKATDKFQTSKPVKIKNRSFSDFHSENRPLSVGEVLTYSSNVGSVEMVERVGKEKQRQFLENLGFFEKIKDFELSERASPSFQSQKNWSDVTMATVSFGHGISVTPLHLITAFSAMVNGGIYHAPTLVKSRTKKVARRVLSEHTSEQLRTMLRDVVLYGTAKKAEVKGYEVAGKTGTAEKVVDGKYAKKRVTNSFISTFPASSPKYALLVVIDEPKGTKETFSFITSGWNAVPVAGKIIAKVAPQLDIKANFDLQTQRANISAYE